MRNRTQITVYTQMNNMINMQTTYTHCVPCAMNFLHVSYTCRICPRNSFNKTQPTPLPRHPRGVLNKKKGLLYLYVVRGRAFLFSGCARFGITLHLFYDFGFVTGRPLCRHPGVLCLRLRNPNPPPPPRTQYNTNLKLYEKQNIYRVFII